DQELAMGSNACWGAFNTGDWDLAQALIAELDGVDLPDWARVKLGVNAAYVPAARGDFSDALARLADIQPLIAASTDPSWHADFFQAQSFLALAQGRTEEAYNDALSASDADPRFTADAALPGVLLGRKDQMEAVVDRIDRAQVHNVLTGCARRMLVAGLAAVDGRTEHAAVLFGEAVTGWRELGNVVQLTLCELAFVRLIGSQDPDASAAATEARETLTRLGAVPFLAQLDAAERSPQPV
ncbi:MAG: hypothetical protein M3P18_12015, partial [Actinomycetota bacterium]|nr:hypothetical protein [Actinomycetota bacterium]